jgi:hypothetical protein
MRAEQIEELMQQLNRAKLAHLLPSENDDGDDPRGTRQASEVLARTVSRHSEPVT